ncbi:MAG: nucleotidyltransferase [Rikenellaceae bacterium]
MKPTLFVLAAGMGSRYGGLKQLDGVGPNGETIMDYSIFDAIRGGFGKVVFVIRKDFEADFREKILCKYENHIPVELVFQAIDDLPTGFTAPEDRAKPWGTNHAVLMGKSVINEPFAVINADDFYGSESFAILAEELMSVAGTKGKYSMVGYRVGNTLSESGSVARGVCVADEGGFLTDVVERTAIEKIDGKISFTDENGDVQTLEENTPVSMNMWGFTPDYFEYSEEIFVDFLSKELNNPKSEFFIPLAVNKLIGDGVASVKVLDTPSKWFGVTYAEDRPSVVAKLAALMDGDKYPTSLFK